MSIINPPIGSPISSVLPLRNAITRIGGVNLIGYWPVIGGESIVRDHSGRNNHLVRSGASYAAGPRGNVLNFDGVDDYCYQQPLLTGTTGPRLSLVNGTAFIDNIGNLAAYQGCVIVFTDSAGKKAWGYIGPQGTGETLGSDTLAGWDFTSGWTAVNATINDNNTFTATTDNGRVYKQGYTTVNKLYKLLISGTISNGTFTLKETVTSRILLSNFGSTYYTAGDTGFSVGFLNNGVVCDINVFTTQQVFTPSTFGCLIYSTCTGSTQNWANIESGFNANSLVSWEIRKADFQIVEALTLGAWIKPNRLAGTNFLNIFSKGPPTTTGINVQIESSDKIWFYTPGTISHPVWDTNISVASRVNTWFFIVCVYSGTKKYLYINDVEQTNIIDSGAMTNSYNRLVIAGRDDSSTRFFQGNIIHSFVANRAFNQPEIRAIYNDPACRP